MVKLLAEHIRKSSSNPSSGQSSSRRPARSPSQESRGKKKSMRFSKQAQALVAESDTKHKDGANVESTISNENSCDEDARVAIEMVSTAADAAHFAPYEKASFGKGEISYTASQSRKSSSDWIYDTGATAHMTDQIDAFKSDPRVNKSGRRKVRVGGGSLSIRGRGTISTKLALSKMKLHNVLFVPNLGANFISSA